MAKMPVRRMKPVSPKEYRQEVLEKSHGHSLPDFSKAETPWTPTEAFALMRETRDHLSPDEIAHIHRRNENEIRIKAFELGVVFDSSRAQAKQEAKPSERFEAHVAEWDLKHGHQLRSAIRQWIKARGADNQHTSWAVIRRQLEYIHQRRKNDLPGTFEYAFTFICRGLFLAKTVKEWMMWFEHPSRIPIQNCWARPGAKGAEEDAEEARA